MRRRRIRTVVPEVIAPASLAPEGEPTAPVIPGPAPELVAVADVIPDEEPVAAAEPEAAPEPDGPPPEREPPAPVVPEPAPELVAVADVIPDEEPVAAAEPETAPEPEVVVEIKQPVVVAPVPRAKAVEPEPTETTADEEIEVAAAEALSCQIALWRGYRKAAFYARLFQDGEELSVFQSTPFRAVGNGVPERTDDAVKAYETVCAALERDGWVRVESGRAWFDDTFRLELSGPAEPAPE